MKVIIIAAGYGNRIKKSVSNTPKALLDINGKTILERQIEILYKYDIRDIFVVVGPYKEKFTLSNVTYVEDIHFDNHEQLGSLMTARNEISGNVLLIFSDILFDESIIFKTISSDADIGVVVYPEWKKLYEGRTEHPVHEADLVQIDHGKISKIKKNLTTDNKNISEFIGIVKLSAKGSDIFVRKFLELEKNHNGHFHSASSLQKAYLTDMIQELIDCNVNVEPIIVDGKWCEVDTPQDLEKAKQLFST